MRRLSSTTSDDDLAKAEGRPELSKLLMVSAMRQCRQGRSSSDPSLSDIIMPSKWKCGGQITLDEALGAEGRI
jgi:hypothetical protein